MSEYTKGELETKEETNGHIGIYLKDAEMNCIAVVWYPAEANAEHLVKCWNCHDDLLAALEFYADETNSVLLVSGRRNILSDGGSIAKAAIAKAK